MQSDADTRHFARRSKASFDPVTGTEIDGRTFLCWQVYMKPRGASSLTPSNSEAGKRLHDNDMFIIEQGVCTESMTNSCRTRVFYNLPCICPNVAV